MLRHLSPPASLVRRRACPQPESGAWHVQRRALSGGLLGMFELPGQVWELITDHALFTAVASSVGAFSFWGYVGGPILTFTVLKPLLFGRNFHTIEYPNGSLRTITVRYVNQNRIRYQIAKLHGIPPREVRHLSVWMDKYFSEPLENAAVRHYLSTATADGSWIFWTRDVENIIPTKGLTLESLGTDDAKLARFRAERVQKYLLNFETTANKDLQITEEPLQKLLGLCAQQDPVLMALHVAHAHTASAFRCLALLRLQQLDQEAASQTPQPPGRSEELASMIRFLAGLADEHRRQQQEDAYVREALLQGQTSRSWLWLLGEGSASDEALVRTPPRQQSRGAALPYDAGVQLTAHVLTGSATPLTLFTRFQLTPAIFVRHAEHFLQKKGGVLEVSTSGVFRLARPEPPGGASSTRPGPTVAVQTTEGPLP